MVNEPWQPGLTPNGYQQQQEKDAYDAAGKKRRRYYQNQAAAFDNHMQASRDNAARLMAERQRIASTGGSIRTGRARPRRRFAPLLRFLLVVGLIVYFATHVSALGWLVVQGVRLFLTIWVLLSGHLPQWGYDLLNIVNGA